LRGHHPHVQRVRLEQVRTFLRPPPSFGFGFHGVTVLQKFGQIKMNCHCIVLLFAVHLISVNNTEVPMNTREQRGIVIAATVKLTHQNGQWFVPSQTGADKKYTVDPCKGTCTCPDHVETGFVCKHQYAVKFTITRERLADGAVVEQKTFEWREEKTYTQNWPAYNAAQTTEKHRFQELLFDLCSGVSEGDRQPGRGRPKTPLADMAVATTFKVYTTLSSRRFACDLRDAQDKGYFTPSIHFNAINAFLESAELTPVLKSLIVRSAGPLRSVERDFAVDSSGFSVSRFVKWH